MLSLTPIRVRGKRTGTDIERARQPSRRKPARQPSSPLRPETTSRTSSRRPKKRKYYERELAMIEQLPVELVEDIFERSQNMDLPAASPILFRQLNHPHLYRRVLGHAMAPLLFSHDDSGNQLKVDTTDEDVVHAVRVVNSKFCTWKLFSDWLYPSNGTLSDLDEIKPTLSPGYDIHLAPLYSQDVSNNRLEHVIPAYKSRFGRLIVPIPPKLIVGPFSLDKEKFLILLLKCLHDNDRDLAIPRDEDLHKALVDAIKEQKAELIRFIVLNAASTERIEIMAPDLLHIAVCEHCCNEDVISLLIDRAKLDLPDRTSLYLELWQWAEDAERAGSDDGRWLKVLLRKARP